MKMPGRARGSVDPPTSSMGDIAFLLIIFFMLTTTITQQTNIDAEPPRAEHLDTMNDTPSVTVAIDRHGKIYYNGKTRDYAVDDVKDMVEKDMENVVDPNRRVVLFRCDKDIERGKFEAYIAAISRAGARCILAGTSGIPEEE